MSATIYLFRHGIAAPARPGEADEERALTDDGRRKVGQIARGLKKIGVRPDLVLASPLKRAQQTAAIAAAILDPRLKVETQGSLAFGFEAADVLADLEGYREHRDILLVGHQPSMGELASHLLTGQAHLAPLPFKKAAMAAIEVQSVPPRAPGVLMWFMSPRQMRALG